MGEVIMQTGLESEEQGGELGTAALEQAYAEQDEGKEPAAAELTAIVPARKWAAFGDLLAARQAFDVARADIEADSSLALATLRQQMTAPMSALPRLMLGDSAIESLRRASLGPTVRELAESMTLASGITDSISAWRNTLDSVGESAREIMRGAGILSDVAESFNSISRINAWQDSLPSINVARLMNEQALQTIARDYAAEQQQQEKAMLAAFADIGRWQGPSLLWREAVHSVYELAPVPPAEQIEVVQADDQLTLESIDLALKQGRLSPAELENLLQQYKSGMQERLSPEILFVAQLYKQYGHRYDTQETFVMYLRDKKNFPISAPTFKRWIKKYEDATGECLRPGKGSRKRRSM